MQFSEAFEKRMARLDTQKCMFESLLQLDEDDELDDDELSPTHLKNAIAEHQQEPHAHDQRQDQVIANQISAVCSSASTIFGTETARQQPEIHIHRPEQTTAATYTRDSQAEQRPSQEATAHAEVSSVAGSACESACDTQTMREQQLQALEEGWMKKGSLQRRIYEYGLRLLMHELVTVSFFSLVSIVRAYVCGMMHTY
jgi:hypothetical protein